MRDVATMKEYGDALFAEDLHGEIQPRFAPPLQNVQKTFHLLVWWVTTLRGEFIWNRQEVLDTALLDDDLSVIPTLSQQQPDQTPAGQRRERIQAAGESSIFMIDVRRQWRFERETTGIITVHHDAHCMRERYLVVQGRL